MFDDSLYDGAEFYQAETFQSLRKSKRKVDYFQTLDQNIINLEHDAKRYRNFDHSDDMYYEDGVCMDVGSPPRSISSVTDNSGFANPFTPSTISLKMDDCEFGPVSSSCEEMMDTASFLRPIASNFFRPAVQKKPDIAIAIEFASIANDMVLTGIQCSHCLKSSSNHHQRCTYCEKLCCVNDCLRSCESCAGLFCSLCSCINYKGAFERIMCLDCDGSMD